MNSAALPAIPAKRYFTIGEVADLCGVKPHVLRYWEQEFTQLNPMKRRGNRRYYQHHEVLMVRRIRDLLYEQGFTISGARHQLENSKNGKAPEDSTMPQPGLPSSTMAPAGTPDNRHSAEIAVLPVRDVAQLRQELEAISLLLN